MTGNILHAQNWTHRTVWFELLCPVGPHTAVVLLANWLFAWQRDKQYSCHSAVIPAIRPWYWATHRGFPLGKVAWSFWKLFSSVVKGSLRLSDCTTNLTASRHVVVHVHHKSTHNFHTRFHTISTHWSSCPHFLMVASTPILYPEPWASLSALSESTILARDTPVALDSPSMRDPFCWISRGSTYAHCACAGQPPLAHTLDRHLISVTPHSPPFSSEAVEPMLSWSSHKKEVGLRHRSPSGAPPGISSTESP